MVSVLDWPAFMFWPAVRDCPAVTRAGLPVVRLDRAAVARDDSMALDSFGPSVIASSRPEPLELPDRISSAQSLT